MSTLGYAICFALWSPDAKPPKAFRELLESPGLGFEYIAGLAPCQVRSAPESVGFPYVNGHDSVVYVSASVDVSGPYTHALLLEVTNADMRHWNIVGWQLLRSDTPNDWFVRSAGAYQHELRGVPMCLIGEPIFDPEALRRNDHIGVVFSFSDSARRSHDPEFSIEAGARCRHLFWLMGWQTGHKLHGAEIRVSDELLDRERLGCHFSMSIGFGGLEPLERRTILDQAQWLWWSYDQPKPNGWELTTWLRRERWHRRSRQLYAGVSHLDEHLRAHLLEQQKADDVQLCRSPVAWPSVAWPGSAITTTHLPVFDFHSHYSRAELLDTSWCLEVLEQRCCLKSAYTRRWCPQLKRTLACPTFSHQGPLHGRSFGPDIDLDAYQYSGPLDPERSLLEPHEAAALATSAGVQQLEDQDYNRVVAWRRGLLATSYYSFSPALEQVKHQREVWDVAMRQVRRDTVPLPRWAGFGDVWARVGGPELRGDVDGAGP